MAESLGAQSSQLTSVVGDPPVEHSSSGYTWSLETPHSGLGVLRPRLILSAPVDEDEEAYVAERGPGVYEAAFWVEPGGKEGTSATPYDPFIAQPSDAMPFRHTASWQLSSQRLYEVPDWRQQH
ncbi:hypothetical protein F5J12DRAFT_780361 [Pisolithus orientalis]|uniref:uncharacterized protein n=1 Tax=Pisolithus orientalis TaxID=936130 RepID=UPI00222442A3|nr:uncharacterized protein F5J12DRAFT_780361 [Pisolithus orientalis]KAI6028827.1 hypothetical protein F5J12DRAFT_780361 [Pisolithus orientalis]